MAEVIELGKLRRRTRHGDYSREGQKKEFAPAVVYRLREASMRDMAAPEWATELGRLYLTERITHGEYAAGRRFAELNAAYRQSIGAVPARSGALELGIRSEPPDPDSEAGEKLAKRERSIAERYTAAHRVLADAGLEVESAVMRLCVDNEAMIGGDIGRAKMGLSILEHHWWRARP